MLLLGAASATATGAATATAAGIDLQRPEEGGPVHEALLAERAMPQEEVLHQQLQKNVQKLHLIKHFVYAIKYSKVHPPY